MSRWLDWTEANRAIYLGTIAPGEDIADPDVRRVAAELGHRAVALVAAFHSDIAQDSPRLRYALVCWTGLNRAATRRWLRGEASRETTHELLVSTLEHVLRAFGAPRFQRCCGYEPWATPEADSRDVAGALQQITPTELERHASSGP